MNGLSMVFITSTGATGYLPIMKDMKKRNTGNAISSAYITIRSIFPDSFSTAMFSILNLNNNKNINLKS